MNSAVLQLFVCSTRAKKCAGTSTTLLYKLVYQAASAAEIIRLEASVSGSLREARLSLPAVRSGRLSRRVHEGGGPAERPSSRRGRLRESPPLRSRAVVRRRLGAGAGCQAAARLSELTLNTEACGWGSIGSCTA